MPSGVYFRKKKPLETRNCACGCEQTFECKAYSRKRFINGHNTRLPVEKRRCVCGCGKTFICKVNSIRKYIICGHANKGKKIIYSDATRLKIHLDKNKGFRNKITSQKAIDTIRKQRKGKTNIELYGIKKAKQISDKQSKTTKGVRSGKKHPNWCGGKPNNYGEFWQEIRKSILERDSFKCLICEGNEYLCVHHCIPYKIYQSNDESELKTACKKCHEIIQPIERQEWHNLARLVKNDQLNDAFILGLEVFEKAKNIVNIGGLNL